MSHKVNKLSHRHSNPVDCLAPETTLSPVEDLAGICYI